MNIGGIIGGLIAGALGAALWAAIAYYGNVEIAILAWGIGLAVGVAVSIGSDTGGILAALVAVLITTGSLVGGKYLAVQMAIHDFDNQMHSDKFTIDDDVLVSGFAFEMAEEQVEAGKKLRFRNGKRNLEATEGVEDLPVNIVSAAKKKLDSMSQEDHDALLAERQEEFEMALSAVEGKLFKVAFAESFSLYDILFFLLGIFTAGKVAFSDYVDGESCVE